MCLHTKEGFQVIKTFSLTYHVTIFCCHFLVRVCSLNVNQYILYNDASIIPREVMHWIYKSKNILFGWWLFKYMECSRLPSGNQGGTMVVIWCFHAVSYPGKSPFFTQCFINVFRLSLANFFYYTDSFRSIPYRWFQQ